MYITEIQVYFLSLLLYLTLCLHVFFLFRINALEEQIESQKVTTGQQVEEEGLKYKSALVCFCLFVFNLFFPKGREVTTFRKKCLFQKLHLKKYRTFLFIPFIYQNNVVIKCLKQMVSTGLYTVVAIILFYIFVLSYNHCVSDKTSTSFPGSLFFPPTDYSGGKKRDPGNEVVKTFT